MSGIYHIGSAMRPCFCKQCTRVNPDGSTRHVYWPSHYMVKDHLSYTCSVNRAYVDPDLLESIDPGGELLADIVGGRVVMPGQVAEEMRVDSQAWRKDKLDRLLQSAVSKAQHLLSLDQTTLTAAEFDQLHAWLQLSDPITVVALEEHRWTQVVGSVSIDPRGRETSTVRKARRGLNNLGSISDFFELGHSLAGVPGISSDVATAIADLVRDYPREPRMRQVRAGGKLLRESREQKWKRRKLKNQH